MLAFQKEETSQTDSNWVFTVQTVFQISYRKCFTKQQNALKAQSKTYGNHSQTCCLIWRLPKLASWGFYQWPLLDQRAAPTHNTINNICWGFLHYLLWWIIGFPGMLWCSKPYSCVHLLCHNVAPETQHSVACVLWEGPGRKKQTPVSFVCVLHWVRISSSVLCCCETAVLWCTAACFGSFSVRLLSSASVSPQKMWQAHVFVLFSINYQYYFCYALEVQETKEWTVSRRQLWNHDISEGGKRTPHLEGGKSVWSDVKRRHLHVSEEVIELLWPQRDFGQRLVSDALSQHDTAVQRNVRRLVPAEKVRKMRPRPQTSTAHSLTISLRQWTNE